MTAAAIRKLVLPPVIRVLLHARRATRVRAKAADVNATFTKHKIKPSVALLHFESQYGGLALPGGDDDDDGDEGGWIFGAHACLSSNAHSFTPGSRLVPVAYSPNDIIYFLDAVGRGYAQDTIEDVKPVSFARDGRGLVSRIVLHDTQSSKGEHRELAGAQGAAVARKLKLKLVKEASTEDERFFSDAIGSVIVVERKKPRVTIVACNDAARIAILDPPRARTTRNVAPSKEMEPYAGKVNVRVAFAKLRELPDVFDALPLLVELDCSGNQLTELPPSIVRAPALQALDASHNPLRALPHDIGAMKLLRSLLVSDTALTELPASLAHAKALTKLSIAECPALDVDRALVLIAAMPKLQDLTLPLSTSLASLAPLAATSIKSLYLVGTGVARPNRLPSGIGALKKLQELRIRYADDVAELPNDAADVAALRLLFHKRFSDDDIRGSARKQPEVLYLQAFAKTL